MEEQPHRFGITLTAKLKHAALWEAVKKLGSQGALADAIGIAQSTIGKWINLRDCPPVTKEEAAKRHWKKSKFRRVEKILYELTGQVMEDLFPAALRENKEFLSAQKSIERTQHIDTHLLACASQTRFLLPNPVDVASDRELQERIREQVKTLRPQEQIVVSLRFGLEDGRTQTLDDVARVLKVTRERVRQIEARAIRVLQQPSRSLNLVGFLDVEEKHDPESNLTPEDWRKLGANLMDKRAVMYLCQCDCGNMKEIAGTNLTSKYKPTKSCGCLSGAQNFQGVPDPTPAELAERLKALRTSLGLPTMDQIESDPELMEHWWTPLNME